MSLSTAQLADYTGHIDKILAGADLSTVSVKKVRNQLDLTDLDIDADTKKALNTLIEQRFDVAIAAQDPLKEEDESDEEDDQPKKKRVKHEASTDDHDAKLAAMLQAEENKLSRSTRATRGSAKGTAKPAKKAEKKTRKKKVVEPEYDSEGNEIVKKKNGAFNKEWALSEPLSILAGGATQVISILPLVYPFEMRVGANRRVDEQTPDSQENMGAHQSPRPPSPNRQAPNHLR